MAISLKHSFQSAKADGADASLVRPSNWNAEHTLTLAASRLLGRATATAGNAEEISLGTGLLFSGTSLTLDGTLAAIAPLSFVADRIMYSTGADAFALATFTAFGRTLVANADAAAAQADLGVPPNARTITAGNGLTGGGDLSANRTVTMGTPGSITNSTTNSVTSTSHTHALGFTAAEVYTGTGPDDTNFPLGHTIVMFSQTIVNNNATASPRLYNDDYQYVSSTFSTGYPALSGTWRSRGYMGSDATRYLMQRVA